MALGLPLPRTILTHAHWTMNHSKMSKSTGNVVNPMFAMARYGVDPIRFFLAMNGGFASDANYDNSYIVRDYKNLLQDQLGNLCSRLMRGKGWNVRECVNSLADKQTDNLQTMEKDKRKHQVFLERATRRVSQHMDGLDPRKALDEIMTIVESTNKRMQLARPWDLVKTSGDDPVTRDRVATVIYDISESLRIVGILLQPFMPEKAKKLLDMLGVEDNIEKRSFAATKYGFDPDYGTPKVVSLERGQGGTLFPSLLTDR
ncbi:hypothetical protein FQN49_001405 [Arthroderma sp. PD_2]|nr:hypothetical protein FQN49_001405 [Arthroderma sp. PD_2]